MCSALNTHIHLDTFGKTRGKTWRPLKHDNRKLGHAAETWPLCTLLSAVRVDRDAEEYASAPKMQRYAANMNGILRIYTLVTCLRSIYAGNILILNFFQHTVCI